jgi:hypothetical protein
VRIAYVCYWNRLEKDGIALKIEAQVASWRAAGHEVEVFCLSRGTGESPWRIFPFAGLRGRYRATQSLQRAVVAYEPDLVYLRFELYVPPLGRIMRRFPAVLEIQAKDREEISQRPRRARRSGAYLELNRHLLFSRAVGAVYVTHELARLPRYARHGLPALVLGNGVDLDALRELPAPGNARPRLAFLASVEQDWHGVDKILWLAAALPEVDFDLVGYSPADLPAAPPPNVTAHGVLSREEYEPILAAADAGIGTLALHRKDMVEASPLKVREYLGHGLPILIGYEDTDLVGVDAWWILRLPNEESNVRDGLAEIRSFVAQARGRRVAREEIAGRIAVAAKERARLAFFEAQTPRSRSASLTRPENASGIVPSGPT